MGAQLLPAVPARTPRVQQVGSRACSVSGPLLVYLGLLVLSRLDQASLYPILAAGMRP